ncbi:MAG: hypothetical protein ACTHLA_01190 [Asticcacaulis sp.]|uniref:hypothetical protein n=1 Tax=Asticcacaulis sp. TaxID=1872648 RepID=UPI003F7C1476
MKNNDFPKIILLLRRNIAVRKQAETPRSVERRERRASSDSRGSVGAAHGPDIKPYRKVVYGGLLSEKGRKGLAIDG